MLTGVIGLVDWQHREFPWRCWRKERLWVWSRLERSLRQSHRQEEGSEVTSRQDHCDEVCWKERSVDVGGLFNSETESGAAERIIKPKVQADSALRA